MVTLTVPQPPQNDNGQKKHNNDVYAYQKDSFGAAPNHTTETRDKEYKTVKNAGRFIYNTETNKMQYSVEEKNKLVWKDLA